MSFETVKFMHWWQIRGLPNGSYKEVGRGNDGN